MLDKTLEMMDNTFSDYLMNKVNKDNFEKKLGKVMSALPLEHRKTFVVSIVNERSKEPFFGFRIFPKQDDLDGIADSLVNKKISFKELCKHWKSIENWYMEIDANVFDRNTINFTPQELSAMTIHEIGHTIYSEKILSIMYNAFKEAQMRMKLADRASMKVLYSLYMIPLSVACMQRNFVNAKNEVSIEFYADSILKNYGYSEALLSALDKILRAYGSQNESMNSKQDKVTQSVTWCNMNTTDLARRKDKLKDELFYQSIKSESGYFKAVCYQVLNKIGFKMRERYTGAVVECTLDMLYEDSRYGENQVPVLEYYAPMLDLKISSQLDRAWNFSRSNISYEDALEGIFGSRNRKKNNLKLPSQHEVDEILIEIDRITNHQDRIFVLDLIYDLLDKIDLYEELHANDANFNSRDAGKIKVLRDQLNALRKATLEKKIPGKEYKFFVKVPEGYEG